MAHVVVGVLLAVGGVVGVASPALAAPSDCHSGQACMYSGYDFGNDWFQHPGTLRMGFCIDDFRPNHAYDNITSSFYNNGRVDRAYLYEHPFAVGLMRSLGRGQGISNLGSNNDLASSSYFSSQFGNIGTYRCR